MEAGREGTQSNSDQPKAQGTNQQISQRPPPSSRDPSPTLRRDASSVQSPALPKQPTTTLVPSLPPSHTASPQTSRNTSPVRPSVRPQDVSQATTQRASAIRSRKNSHDASPIRPASTHSSTAPPSAAAIQRALSAANVPTLGQSGATPNQDPTSRLPRASRTAPSTEPQTPVTPGLSPSVYSPGPSAPTVRRNSVPRKLENLGPPPITVQDSTPPGTAVPDLKHEGRGLGIANGETGLAQPQKILNRGPSGPKSNLETVEEATPPVPSLLRDATDQSFQSMNSSQVKGSDDDRTPNGIPSKKEIGNRSGESDGDGNRSDGKGKKESISVDSGKPKTAPAKLPPATARAKLADGTRNMTVETETVASIPQSALTTDRATGQRGDLGGSLRLKPSTETIRPRKERKKASRKAPSVHNGTASSKADIFEARVASQVDEANSSDSDETFVYESNPPEPQLRSTTRNHSRTPSVTSIHSQSDRRLNLRTGYENHRVAGKRSMKFSNNPYSALDSPTDDSTGMGTVRAHHPRNISRFGRTVGSNSSLYGAGEDSPFTQASKLRATIAGGGQGARHSSRPSTPSGAKSAPLGGNQRFGPWRKDALGLRQYEFDDAGEEGSDERTPLFGGAGTVRTPRRYQRRLRDRHDAAGIYNLRQNSWLGRFGGCCLGLVIVGLVILGAGGMLFMSNRSLEELRVERIQNVLASEQEIMLDLVVGAVNPNMLGVAVPLMDLNIFAKSKYIATTSSSSATAGPTPTGFSTAIKRRALDRRRSSPEKEMEHHSSASGPWQDENGHWHSGDEGEGEGLEGDSQTMLLGRVFRFDQGLYFEGSPMGRKRHYSTGEFRLARPGNKTEAGGSARWEHVLGHPFELILRGVVRYQLPVSNREMSAAVRGSVVVHPEEGVVGGRMRIEPVEDDDEEHLGVGGEGLGPLVE